MFTSSSFISPKINFNKLLQSFSVLEKFTQETSNVRRKIWVCHHILWKSNQDLVELVVNHYNGEYWNLEFHVSSFDSVLIRLDCYEIFRQNRRKRTPSIRVGRLWILYGRQKFTEVSSTGSKGVSET